MRRICLGALAFAVAALAWTPHAAAEPGAGTLDDPVLVDAMPYVIRGDTSLSASSAIDAYDCSPATNESGPEVVYKFTLPKAARVTAWLSGDTATVDIDAHLLTDLDVQGGLANACANRNNKIAEANMSAGTHYVVVDTFKGDAQAGPYVLHLDAIGDAWNERPIAEGVTWRSRRYQNQSGGAQVVHSLVIDTKATGVEIVALKSTGCQTIADMAVAAGAVAAINGGIFNAAMCDPLSLLVSKATFVTPNIFERGAFGLTPAGDPAIKLVPAGMDWIAVDNAHGGGPILVTNGTAKKGAAAWSAESFTDATFIGKNPRTFAGIDGGGQVIFGTVDGKRTNAKGMSLDELAAFAASGEIGAEEAVNLDGVDATTMWIKGATYNGVVNYPSSEPTQEVSTHPGSKGVSGGFFVLAKAYNHIPRFQTEPPTDAEIGIPYHYDADAIDLNIDDDLTFELSDGPPGMTVDPKSGEVDYTPPDDSFTHVDVTLTVSDDKGAVGVQAFTLIVAGGQATSGSGVSSGGSDSGGFGGAGSGGFGGGGFGGGCGACGGDAPTPSGPGGYGAYGGYGGVGGADGVGAEGPVPRRCSCFVPGEDGGAPWTLRDKAALGFVLLLAALGARRRK